MFPYRETITTSSMFQSISSIYDFYPEQPLTETPPSVARLGYCNKGLSTSLGRGHSGELLQHQEPEDIRT